jgi:hypothetical protein
LSTNLSILQRNTLLGFSDEAGALYLRGCERCEVTAFWMACEWDERLSAVLRVMVVMAAKPFAAAVDIQAAVVEFAKERHFRSYFPQGREVNRHRLAPATTKRAA